MGELAPGTFLSRCWVRRFELIDSGDYVYREYGKQDHESGAITRNPALSIRNMPVNIDPFDPRIRLDKQFIRRGTSLAHVQ